MSKYKGYLMTSVCIFIMGLMIVSCGSKKKAEDTSAPQNFLPESSAKTNLKRISDVRTFVGQTLWEYIDGGAEIYYLYDFEIVATADYKADSVEIVVDIYKFDSPDNAYGLYSMLRPVDAQPVKLGVEGFLDPASVVFVKGDYVVKLISYDESEQSTLALTNFSEERANTIPGRTTPPETFSLFPKENLIETSPKYFAESYLGQKFLTDVYTQEYIIGMDTIQLFLSDDASGSKFAQWKEIAETTADIEPIADSIGFDQDYSFKAPDRFYGTSLVGLKNDRLVGAVRYKDSEAGFVKSWLAGI